LGEIKLHIEPVVNIYYQQYQYNKKKDNHQKEFVEVVDDLTNGLKCGIINVGTKVDIKI